jgi:hypothetical protein
MQGIKNTQRHRNQRIINGRPTRHRHEPKMHRTSATLMMQPCTPSPSAGRRQIGGELCYHFLVMEQKIMSVIFPSLLCRQFRLGHTAQLESWTVPFRQTPPGPVGYYALRSHSTLIPGPSPGGSLRQANTGNTENDAMPTAHNQALITQCTGLLLVFWSGHSPAYKWPTITDLPLMITLSI